MEKFKRNYKGCCLDRYFYWYIFLIYELFNWLLFDCLSNIGTCYLRIIKKFKVFVCLCFLLRSNEYTTCYWNYFLIWCVIDNWLVFNDKFIYRWILWFFHLCNDWILFWIVWRSFWFPILVVKLHHNKILLLLTKYLFFVPIYFDLIWSSKDLVLILVFSALYFCNIYCLISLFHHATYSFCVGFWIVYCFFCCFNIIIIMTVVKKNYWISFCFVKVWK